MAIEFSCGCGKGFKAKNGTSGQEFRCPECGRNLAVPEPNVFQPGPDTLPTSGIDLGVSLSSKPAGILTPDHSGFDTMVREIESLKKSNRRLCYAGAVGLILAAIAGAMPHLTAKPLYNVAMLNDDGSLEVSQLVIRDREGLLRAVLGYGDRDSVGLSLYSGGKEDSSFRIHRGGQGSISLGGTKNGTAAYMHGGDHPGLGMFDESGHQRIHMTVGFGDPYVAMCSETSDTRIQFGVHRGGIPFMDFFDPNKRYMRLIDDNGQLINRQSDR